MRGLYDQKGEVEIWITDDEKWLLDLHGNAIASVHDGSIFNLEGRHVGWWQGDRIQDHSGSVIFVVYDVGHLRTVKPIWHLQPLPPTPKIMPLRPIFGLRPIEPLASGRWNDPQAFLDDLRRAITAFAHH